ncbi:hypothetical protein [Novosphingobium sp. HII-3]|uniref:hypothetical protein n=1 Tax=Novosphingobium sp. HII-3 TaxID=2075565 RepID=UPI000CDAABC2|nr:hypothetical protein [Novosphingobium sp. HII-3]
MWVFIEVVVIYILSFIISRLLRGQVNDKAVLPISLIGSAVAWFLFMNVVADQAPDNQAPIIITTLIATAIVAVLRFFTKSGKKES